MATKTPIALDTLSDDELKAKRQWYARRGDKFAHKVEEIDEILAARDEEHATPRSVVASKFKRRYAERGNPRGCGDWLQSVLAEQTLDDNRKLDVSALEQIAEANGVSLAKYKREGTGWQGRLRMTAGLILRPIVAAEGKLWVPKGQNKRRGIEAPRDWAVKYIR